MIHTDVCDRIGIEYPIFQGGMAWVSEHVLAAAVSNAGGLGIISAMNAPGEYLRKEIRACREMTDRPFGVNVMLMSPHAPEVAQGHPRGKGAGRHHRRGPARRLHEGMGARGHQGRAPSSPPWPSPSAWRARARPPSSPRAANPAATWAN